MARIAAQSVPILLALVFCAYSACDAAAQDSPSNNQQLPDKVSFNAHIRPIMSNTCFACHGPDEEGNHNGLRLDSFAAAVEEGGAIDPEDAEASAVYQRITDEDDPMPPEEFIHKLSDYDKALFKKWIDQGAQYQDHWSYAPITKSDPPSEFTFEEKVQNPIDQFIFRRLQESNLQPSEKASKATLLRRLSLDLIGLPPTQKELADFIADQSPDAYEKQVDRLLESDRYGERMASQWLDVVRFSDTVGFHGDQNQRIFPYRDYVINSLNNNKPFNEFTREQLAGDLLDSPDDQQRIATGLIRLNMVTREGGAQPEEYLAKYTADRVRMIGTAWLGSTTGCCECHNHKYDPFTIKDFYSLGAFFDDVKQWGVYSSYGYTPNKDLSGFTNNHPFPPEIRTKSQSLEQQIEHLESRLAEQFDSKKFESSEVQSFLKSLVRVLDQSSDGWITLDGLSAKDSSGQEMTSNDGTLLFKGKPKQNQYVLTGLLPEGVDTKSIRIEVLPDPENGDRVGRSENGKFSMSLESVRFDRSRAQPPEKRFVKTDKVKTRFVRIELPNVGLLSLAEVEVFARDTNGELVNVALKGKATQSSNYRNAVASRAIDGNTSGNYSDNTVTHTESASGNWWEVDLGSAVEIDHCVIWNRTDSNLESRLNGFELKFLDNSRKQLWSTSPQTPKPSVKVDAPSEVLFNPFVSVANVVLAQADLLDPKGYRNGQPSLWLGKTWHSGPIRWQLPEDETKRKHTAVFQLDKPVAASNKNQIQLTISSADIGKIRVSVSPLTRFVVGGATTKNLTEAIKRFGKNETLSQSQKQVVVAAYELSSRNPQSLNGEFGRLRDEIARCRSGYAMSLIVRQTDKRRQSRILPRGDWQAKDGEKVDPATPAFLPSSDVPKDRKLTRLDLANWLTSDQNPLVARHYVNRTWKHFFGAGLSAVVEDLGSQGQWPSHPELLDWLAAEFRDGWDMKALNRLIVTSDTYQQAAAVRSDLTNIDPYNRLLSQQSARRLEAEAIRDNALAISGLLFDDYVGGPSVFPYQPTGHYGNLQFPNRSYKSNAGSLQHRRAVYMHWQRTFLHPMLVNFDAPSRDECTANRPQSNSPQQALTLLNDPQFVEASHAFASRVLSESESDDTGSRLDFAFETALSRKPTLGEFDALQSLLKKQTEHYAANVEDAKKYIRGSGLVRDLSAQHKNVAELAAWSQVCRVILNLHETITRF